MDTSFVEFLWVLLLGSLLGLELIGKEPPTLHTPLMSGAMPSQASRCWLHSPPSSVPVTTLFC